MINIKNIIKPTQTSAILTQVLGKVEEQLVPCDPWGGGVGLTIAGPWRRRHQQQQQQGWRAVWRPHHVPHTHQVTHPTHMYAWHSHTLVPDCGHHQCSSLYQLFPITSLPSQKIITCRRTPATINRHWLLLHPQSRDYWTSVSRDKLKGLNLFHFVMFFLSFITHFLSFLFMKLVSVATSKKTILR